jgi:hypothetical protein
MFADNAGSMNSGLESADGAGSFSFFNSSGPSAIAEKPAPKKRKRGPTSDRQREANRQNAAKSTGPKTEDGKAKSAANALQHGVFACAAILPGEEPEEFGAMERLLTEDWGPKTVMEEILLGRLASIHWRLQRLALAEQDLGWRLAHVRMEKYQQQLETSKKFSVVNPPRQKPAELSTGWEMLADDFSDKGKPGKLQQITQLEMRLTGQMLAISRQLVQIRKLRIVEAKAGMGEGAREVNEPAARNEAISDLANLAGTDVRPLTPTLSPEYRGEGVNAAARNEAISQTDPEPPIAQPQSGGSTIALGVSPRYVPGPSASSEGATQDHASAGDRADSESLLQSSDLATTDPGVALRPAGAAPSGAGALTGDRLPGPGPQSPVGAPAPHRAARNEAIRNDQIIVPEPQTPFCGVGG